MLFREHPGLCCHLHGDMIWKLNVYNNNIALFCIGLVDYLFVGTLCTG